ncbi:unnamed protein product, partial [marine sediment metagenome]
DRNIKSTFYRRKMLLDLSNDFNKINLTPTADWTGDDIKTSGAKPETGED